MYLRRAICAVGLLLSIVTGCIWERDNPQDQKGKSHQNLDMAGDMARDRDALADGLGDLDAMGDGLGDLKIDGGGNTGGGCDIDGDGHALSGTTDKACAAMPKDDHDDFDAGRHPGVTMGALNGLEGGHVIGALRQWCSGKVQTKNSTVAKPVYERDIDHDGDGMVARNDGCPSKACDVDGDGFKNKGCNPALSETDCDDSNPHIFPGGPGQVR